MADGKRAQRAGEYTPPQGHKKEGPTVGMYKIRYYLKSEIFWLLVICLVAIGVTIFARSMPLRDSVAKGERESMLFMGDVMLARNIERLMNTYGTYYPFKGIRDLLAGHEVVIGNFEGSIPTRHVQTPSLAFRFSVASSTAPVLSRVGFTDMTLANNHAYDYGEETYTNTREVLQKAGLAVGGNPRMLSNDEVLYHTIDDVQVAIIPINTIGGTPTLEQITKVLVNAAKKSDVQIVSIHWGTEYELVSNDAQRAHARALIDAGADTIIGHHPHVVQDIEEYRGAPIFYSLGNCIFDQYWDANVQEGLAVALSFTENKIHYVLIPLTSVDTQSAPRPMNRIERLQFLDTLASRSEESLVDAIKDGNIIELFSRRTADNLLDS